MRISVKVRRALAATAAIALLFSIESTNLAGTGSLAARGHAFMDALTLIASRSPGDRINSFLTKTKMALAPATAGTDREARALPRTRTPKPDPAETFEPFREAAAARPQGDDLPLAFNPDGVIPGIPFAYGGGEGAAPPGGSFGGPLPWGGGGIGGGGGGGGGGTVPPEPPAGVPEPATWAIWMLGFGMLGWILRRRSSASVAIDA